MNVTLTLHAIPPLSRYCYRKAHVNHRLFPFSYLSRKESCLSLTRDHISEKQYVMITSGYRIDRES